MSQLRRVIERSQRGEVSHLGFGAARREKPRGMALGVIVRDEKATREALDAGVDLVVIRPKDVNAATKVIRAVGETKTPLGVWLSDITADDTARLKEAGADFVASSLDGTIAEAVDTEELGHVLAVTGEIEEATLRALGALRLDGMFVKRPGGEMTLQNQVELARLSALSGLQLLVSSPADASAGELRVLRDSGAVAIIAADGSTADELRSLSERLRSLPPRGRSRSNDFPLIPSAAPAQHDHEHDDDGE